MTDVLICILLSKAGPFWSGFFRILYKTGLEGNRMPGQFRKLQGKILQLNVKHVKMGALENL